MTAKSNLVVFVRGPWQRSQRFFPARSNETYAPVLVPPDEPRWWVPSAW
jgi:hypothetical protein